MINEIPCKTHCSEYCCYFILCYFHELKNGLTIKLIKNYIVRIPGVW